MSRPFYIPYSICEFPSEIYILFGQESRPGIFVKNKNIWVSFNKKSKIWSKIELLVKKRTFVKNRTFGQETKLWQKIEPFVKKYKF